MIFEEAIGTNPNSPDSDGDGVSDGVEVGSGTDPLNSLPEDQKQNLEVSELIKNNDTKALSDLLENGIKNIMIVNTIKTFGFYGNIPQIFCKKCYADNETISYS